MESYAHRAAELSEAPTSTSTILLRRKWRCEVRVAWQTYAIGSCCHRWKAQSRANSLLASPQNLTPHLLEQHPSCGPSAPRVTCRLSCGRRVNGRSSVDLKRLYAAFLVS